MIRTTSLSRTSTTSMYERGTHRDIIIHPNIPKTCTQSHSEFCGSIYGYRRYEGASTR